MVFVAGISGIGGASGAMSNAQATVRPVLRLVGVRLDPEIPEHVAVHEQYMRVAPGGRAEWLRFHLIRSVLDMRSKLTERQPVAASVPRVRRDTGKTQQASMESAEGNTVPSKTDKAGEQ